MPMFSGCREKHGYMTLEHPEGLKIEGKIKLNGIKKLVISLSILQFFGTGLFF